MMSDACKFPIVFLFLFCTCFATFGEQLNPELAGHYMFNRQLARAPPHVAPPAYIFTFQPCPGASDGTGNNPRSLRNNLCGDLGQGVIPLNPMLPTATRTAITQPYPFELIKNKTLELFRSTLPILREDTTLPRVARLAENNQMIREMYEKQREYNTSPRRSRRSGDAKYRSAAKVASAAKPDKATGVSAKSANTDTGFCQSSFGRICSLFSGWSGNGRSDSNSPSTPVSSSSSSATAAAAAGATVAAAATAVNLNQQAQLTSAPPLPLTHRSSAAVAAAVADQPGKAGVSAQPSSQSPPPPPPPPPPSPLLPATPCPAAVDYITPVFARNHENVWRYVVQIPHEGYFTQTVEVITCLGTRCQFLEGRCLASPRWLSLLVAELFYPHSTFAPAVVNIGTATAAAAAPAAAAVAAGGGGGDSASSAAVVTETVAMSTANVAVNGSASAADDTSSTLAGRHMAEQQKDGVGANTEIDDCDGVDELGCFQVRLYFDWFLVPGGCKCWRPAVFQQFRSGSSTP